MCNATYPLKLPLSSSGAQRVAKERRRVAEPLAATAVMLSVPCAVFPTYSVRPVSESALLSTSSVPVAKLPNVTSYRREWSRLEYAYQHSRAREYELWKQPSNRALSLSLITISLSAHRPLAGQMRAIPGDVENPHDKTLMFNPGRVPLLVCSGRCHPPIRHDL